MSKEARRHSAALRKCARRSNFHRPPEDVPRDYVDQLLNVRPHLIKEGEDIVAQFACLIWSWDAKHRQHHVGDGSVSISFQEIRRRFGRRRFKQLNERHALFIVSADWSVGKRQTKRYALHPDIEAMDEEYCSKYDALTLELTPLVMEDGRRRRTVPQAVAAKDKRGNSIKCWRKRPINSLIPVDLRSLQCRAAYCSRLLNRDAPLRAAESVALRRLRRLFVKLLRMAHTDIAGRGFVLVRYQESDSGRLYASGLSLQTVPREIRAVCMNGMFDYDIANCHFALFKHIAARYQFPCPMIDHYLANKGAVRAELAARIGCTAEQIKKCLIALMYGAHQLDYYNAAIPSILQSRLMAKRFKCDAWIKSLRAELDAGRDVILERWQQRNRGALVNEAGKSISPKAKPRQQLAHILQGAEAVVLRALVDAAPDSIVLLQHDGFTSTVRLDVAHLEAVIEDRTGYRLALEERLICAPPQSERTKTLPCIGCDGNNSLRAIPCSSVSVNPSGVGVGVVCRAGQSGGLACLSQRTAADAPTARPRSAGRTRARIWPDYESDNRAAQGDDDLWG